MRRSFWRRREIHPTLFKTVCQKMQKRVHARRPYVRIILQVPIGAEPRPGVATFICPVSQVMNYRVETSFANIAVTVEIPSRFKQV